MTGEILFLAHRVPYPPDRGDKMRSFHILRHLAGLAPVHLATFADDDADIAHADALRPMLRTMHVEKRTRSTAMAAMRALPRGRPISVEAFASRTMQSAVDTILASGSIDAIFVFSGQMAQFVPPFAGRFVMDFVDVDSAKFAAYADAAPRPLRWLHAREARLLARYERDVAERADLSLFVSAQEAAAFRGARGLDGGSVATLENGIDLAYYDPAGAFDPPALAGEAGGPLIVFTGQMNYRPNIDAAAGFARDILPVIRARHPGARFAIVGRKPDAALSRLDGRGGVIVTGAVADVRGWIAAADVVVAPLSIARGIQNKVLEGMAMARPVVATPAAFEGIDAVPGRDLIVAPIDAMAAAIGDLLGRPDRAAAIGRAARALVERRYGWDARLAPLRGMIGRADVPPEGAAA
nr:TIGR03087 family PEP-CTERM/XrtA system glycosyltransferase [Sphingomonas bacterium]